jgi:predicted dehydrogenase
VNDHEAAVPRRKFLRAVTACSTLAPAFLSARNLNSRIGVACVGVGTQGHWLMQEAQKIPDAEVRVICDLYQGNIKRAQGLCTNPRVRILREWEKAVEDREVDVVIIATPDFWHGPMTVRAAEARKDIYVEKGWCTRLDDAKRMRRAVKDNKVVMQLGHHYNSKPSYHRARQIYQSGQLGKVPLVRMFIDRTRRQPEWKFYTNYTIYEMPKDAGPATIDWERFIANAPKRPFDAERFFTWRCYWDYGTGIAGDLMCHVWDGLNMIMGMGIPERVETHGVNYFWKGDRDVPDMWHVIFDYPKQELAIVFGCGFHTRHTGEVTEILGREKTLEVGQQVCRVYDAEWKPEYAGKLEQARREATKTGRQPGEATVPPDYSMAPDELTLTSHMEDFFDCVRRRGLPRCHVDRAFEEAVAILMSVEAHKRGRAVRWDSLAEEIV